jgi:hypothetical protein
MKAKIKSKLKIYWNLGVFLVLLESLWQVKFNRVCFYNFQSLDVKDIEFLVDFVAENLSKLQKLGLEGKIS